MKKLSESVWVDIHKRSNCELDRKEESIDSLDYNEFFQYLKDHYEVCVPDPDNFYQIGQWLDPNTMVGNIAIAVAKGSKSNFRLRFQKNMNTNEFLPIIINLDFFKTYPREIERTFGDKYELNTHPANIFPTISPKEGKITNSVCVDVLDKILSIVEEPIFRKKV